MLAGVFAFDAVFPHLPEWGIRAFPQSMTLPVLLDVSYASLAIALGVAVLLMVAFADRFDPAARSERGAQPAQPLSRREWGFATAGFAVGLVILAANLQGQYLGVTGGFAALVAHLGQPLGFALNSVPTLDATTAWRAAMVAGIFAGATASALQSGSFRNVPVTPLWQAAFPSGLKTRAGAVLGGGFLIMFGALLGGGCTTGALMAGFPTLSVGSFAMGMTFFGAGMATAFVLYWGRWRRFAEVRAQRPDLATD